MFDYVSKETGRTPTDRRLAVDLRILQEYFRSSNYTLRWVCGPQMLADTLTKLTADPTYLHNTLSRGTYQVVRDATLEGKIKKGCKEGKKKAVSSETQTQRLQKKEKLRERNQRKLQNHHRRMRQISTPAATYSLISSFSWLASTVS